MPSKVLELSEKSTSVHKEDLTESYCIQKTSAAPILRMSFCEHQDEWVQN